MPFYCYECDKCGHTMDSFHLMRDVPKYLRCEKCGEKMERNIGRQIGKQYRGESPVKGKPSAALGVAPEDVQATIEEDKRIGVSASGWTKGGDPWFDSDVHKRKYMKAHGFHFKNSYL